jgi:hypothetical protein
MWMSGAADGADEQDARGRNANECPGENLEARGAGRMRKTKSRGRSE